MSANILSIFYLISGVLFILALRGLSSPETSRQGNMFGIVGMAIAIGVTIISVGNFSTGFIYLLIFLYFKITTIYFFSFLIALYISLEVFLYNADFTFFINTFLFFIFSIFLKNKNVEEIYKNKLLLFILYSLSSKHLIEFLKVKFQLSFDPSILFEIIFLVIVFYKINSLNKNE